MSDKLRTWNDSPLEAHAAQFDRCAACGGIVLSLETEDGSVFAVAHLGDTAQGVLDWLIESLRYAAVQRGETLQ